MSTGVRAAIFALAAGALSAECAVAHSTDFILAKVSPHDGRVEVELTADYGGNPMFASKAEAQAVLTQVLRVKTGATAGARDLREVAPLQFEERTQFDPTAPIPLDPTTSAEAHQLLCARWSWKSAAAEVSFEMPQDAGQTVILWTPAETPGQPPRWVFLLPGESSPKITIPHRPGPSSWIASLELGLAGVAATIGFRWRPQRIRRGSVDPLADAV